MPRVGYESSCVVLVLQGQQCWVPMTAHPHGSPPSGTLPTRAGPAAEQPSGSKGGSGTPRDTPARVWSDPAKGPFANTAPGTGTGFGSTKSHHEDARPQESRKQPLCHGAAKTAPCKSPLRFGKVRPQPSTEQNSRPSRPAVPGQAATPSCSGTARCSSGSQKI